VVSEQPRFVSLEQLISLKLDSWANHPTRRLKDKADVIELIQARRLPRDLNVANPVRQHYLETWDALQAERCGTSFGGGVSPLPRRGLRLSARSGIPDRACPSAWLSAYSLLLSPSQKKGSAVGGNQPALVFGNAQRRRCGRRNPAWQTGQQAGQGESDRLGQVHGEGPKHFHHPPGMGASRNTGQISHHRGTSTYPSCHSAYELPLRVMPCLCLQNERVVQGVHSLTSRTLVLPFIQ
jgi:hypothetical protein